MNDILELRNTFISQTNKLLQYVKLLDNDEKVYYRKNQEILYIGIINRAYSLWETYNKDLIFAYYLLVKNDLIKEGALVQKLKLYELPGYIFEDGLYDNLKNSIYFEMKKDFITYTGKNMDSSQMKILYSRFDVKMVEKLRVSKIIKDFLADKELLFQITNTGKSEIEQALSRLIQERNLVSHYSTIDDYVSLDTIHLWIEFYQLAANEVCKIICINYINKITINKNEIGKYVKFLDNRKVLLIDINPGIVITKNSLIGLYNQDNIEQILIPIGFMVNDKFTDKVVEKDNAGIQFQSFFNENFKINPNSKLYILDDSVFK